MPRRARRSSACPTPRCGQRASAVLAKFAPPQRSDALARYQAALKLADDRRRGAAVFAKNCQTCHQHQGQGHRVGPDLSGIAGRAPGGPPDRHPRPQPRSRARLHRPRRSPPTAARSSRDSSPKRPPRPLKLRRAEGIEETLLRSEIDELRSTGQSLMPEGLEQTINLQEMADLIAFLRRNIGH